MTEAMKQKRQVLSEKSRDVAPLVERGEFDTINEAVINTFYKTAEHTEFNTFEQWKAKGYQVIKGEKAFIVWSRPQAALDEEKGKEIGEENSRFFRLCFLFSNKQVRPIKS
jgi:hypothetical protein